mgnify:CR=1 FL=1
MYMKPVGLDEESYGILKKVRNTLKKKGINGVTFSDAVKKLAENHSLVK